MTRTTVGLLPLYLKLYDDTRPEIRDVFRPLLESVVAGFENRGVGVVQSGICRLESEFAVAVRQFEDAGVDIIVTLHLAYSPSLEALGPLTTTDLSILMLDTTMDHAFGQDVDPARIMHNHGIHGVQDLASMLRREGKPFEIVAGHVTESNVLERAARIAQAAHGAQLFRTTKALRIGESFKGMGDFSVDEVVMHSALGITVDQVAADALSGAVGGVSAEDVAEEMRLDCERFTADVADDVHERSVCLGLGLRRYLEEGGYSAFSMNFLAFDSSDGPVNTVPFLEASKAMARGIGYAGEGDVLTASLVGALSRAFGKTTFTEIFCPDWKGNSLFLSHMGEINPEVAADTPRLSEKDFPWTNAMNPAVIGCAPAPGPAVMVNLAPGPDDSFDLIVAPVEVLGDASNPALHDTVRGWIRPWMPLELFLETYSCHGGTHHSALVLGDKAEAVEAFAAFAGIECISL
jgi:L-arabinose isomerase